MPYSNPMSIKDMVDLIMQEQSPLYNPVLTYKENLPRYMGSRMEYVFRWLVMTSFLIPFWGSYFNIWHRFGPVASIALLIFAFPLFFIPLCALALVLTGLYCIGEVLFYPFSFLYTAIKDIIESKQDDFTLAYPSTRAVSVNYRFKYHLFHSPFSKIEGERDTLDLSGQLNHKPVTEIVKLFKSIPIHIRHLKLTNNFNIWDRRTYDELTEIFLALPPHLESLDLSNNASFLLLDSQPLAALSPRLTVLKLNDCNIYGGPLAELLPLLPASLTSLELRNNPRILNGFSLPPATVLACKQLKLDISHTQFPNSQKDIISRCQNQIRIDQGSIRDLQVVINKLELANASLEGKLENALRPSLSSQFLIALMGGLGAWFQSELIQSQETQQQLQQIRFRISQCFSQLQQARSVLSQTQSRLGQARINLRQAQQTQRTRAQLYIDFLTSLPKEIIALDARRTDFFDDLHAGMLPNQLAELGIDSSNLNEKPDFLNGLPQLTSIQLEIKIGVSPDGTKVVDDCLTHIPHTVKELDLSHNKLGELSEGTLVALLAQVPSHIRIINLNHNKLFKDKTPAEADKLIELIQAALPGCNLPYQLI